MRKINVIMHYANEGLSTYNISLATAQTYRKTVINILDKSGLSISEKKEVLGKIIIQEVQ